MPSNGRRLRKVSSKVFSACSAIREECRASIQNIVGDHIPTAGTGSDDDASAGAPRKIVANDLNGASTSFR